VLLLEGIRRAVTKLLKGGGTYEKAVEEFVRDLQRELLRADVNVKLVLEISRRVKERGLKEEPPPGVSRRDWLVKIVYDELTRLFGGDREPEVMPRKTPWVMMLVGVQGSGKTTTAGKLALYYSRRGYKVGLVSADTYRPGAYEQLRRLAEQAGAMFYGEKRGDPVEIAWRGVRELISRGAEIVIVDTAGRHGMGEEEKLLEEMKAMAEKVKPDEVVMVIDASMGQRAGPLAERFHRATPLASIIVTKMDGTARGGGALSAAAATGARIKFVGTGEKLEEIEPFSPRRFVARILGMGDIEGLLDRIKTAEAAEDLEEAAEDLLKGRVNMRVIYRQLKAMRKLGPLSKVLQMIPGFSMLQGVSDEALSLGEEKLKKWMAIIESMTYEELDNPEIIDRRRMRRIALGSGTSVEDVKELLAYYKGLKVMVRRLRRDRRLLRRLGIE
jgi:signal recognition particle subunit SRP54